MMKPPARGIAIDALEDLWRNCESPLIPSLLVLYMGGLLTLVSR